jgi:hypothetical protein
MVGKGSQRGLGLPSLWLACELHAISVLIARFGVTCPYKKALSNFAITSKARSMRRRCLLTIIT